jgi:hypothetical protein
MCLSRPEVQFTSLVCRRVSTSLATRLYTTAKEVYTGRETLLLTHWRVCFVSQQPWQSNCLKRYRIKSHYLERAVR